MPDDITGLADLLSMRPTRTRHDWHDVQRRLGTALPPDYMRMIDTYGGGWIDDLGIYEPDAANPNFDLLRAGPKRIADLQVIWTSEGGQTSRPAPMDNPGTELINWASSGYGEYLYWVARDGVPPEQWTVSLEQGRGGEWEHSNVGCVAYLTGLLNGTIHSEYLDWMAQEGPFTYLTFDQR